jgi:DNA processing protein
VSVDDERLARITLMRIAEPDDVELSAALSSGAADVVARLRAGSLPIKAAEACRRRLDGYDPLRDLELADASGARLVCPGDPEWPTQLDDLGLRGPFGLWVRGETDLRRAAVRSISVVGARAATGYGQTVATELAAGVAERGFAVVSGAAYGIDSAAHRGALAVAGVTVAVLACGVDVPYPRAHAALLCRIAADGCVVSELAPGVTPSRHRFLVRNRLIAALSAGTVVVEAGLRSGAGRTAEDALGLCRVLMGIPGPVTSVVSSGVHRMIREGGAILVTNVAEVIEAVGDIGADLAPVQRGPAALLDSLPGECRRVFDALPARRPADVLELARESGFGAEQVIAALGQLSALGLVERVDGGWRISRGMRRAGA